MKPNIFNFATKELSQDGFFTWLLQWANDDYRQHDKQLNETSKDFIRLLLGKETEFLINKVIAGRQLKNIDIWAEINDEYFIAIEDKTNTGEHSNQLERYKQFVTNHYEDKKHKLIFIYLKTGNESLSTLSKIKDKGYSSVDRKMVLDVLNKRTLTNEIFNDFKDYLTVIENATNSYTKFDNITSDWKAGEGFYIKLQEQISEWSDWCYVANQMGGFLGFWYHWTKTDECSLYIQIENYFERGIKVVIKIGDWEPNIHTLRQILSEIQPYAKKHNLTITKPNKYRAGSSSTLAIIQDPFPIDKDGNIEIEKFIEKLKNIENTLEEYCEEKKHSR